MMEYWRHLRPALRSSGALWRILDCYPSSWSSKGTHPHSEQLIVHFISMFVEKHCCWKETVRISGRCTVERTVFFRGAQDALMLPCFSARKLSCRARARAASRIQLRRRPRRRPLVGASFGGSDISPIIRTRSTTHVPQGLRHTKQSPQSRAWGQALLEGKLSALFSQAALLDQKRCHSSYIPVPSKDKGHKKSCALVHGWVELLRLRSMRVSLDQLQARGSSGSRYAANSPTGSR